MIKAGMKNQIQHTVRNEDTALSVGSGELNVLATPKMLALMEECAYKAIAKELENGITTVGTHLDVKHVSATPVGMTVSVEAEVSEVDGRKIVFSVRAYDERGLIGEGTHERFCVNAEKFTRRTYSK